MSGLAHFPLHVAHRAWNVRRSQADPTQFWGLLSANDGKSRTELGSLNLVLDALMAPAVRLGLPIIFEDASLATMQPALSRHVARHGRPLPPLPPVPPYGGKAL